ncbi:MAG: branched-chain amino acid ABC transporter permease, partial [Armatimonadota bacterium]|nr:branched-chain amino acid ABC transporter permease [Armatimonadota bacterium]
MNPSAILASPRPRTRIRAWMPAGLTGVAALLPLGLRSVAHQNLLVLIAINIILVASLDLLIGQTGLISLGHAGFWGVGAYTSALLVMRGGLPFPLALLGAAAAAAVAGLFIGYPSLRLRGHY